MLSAETLPWLPTTRAAQTPGQPSLHGSAWPGPATSPQHCPWSCPLDSVSATRVVTQFPREKGRLCSFFRPLQELGLHLSTCSAFSSPSKRSPPHLVQLAPVSVSLPQGSLLPSHETPVLHFQTTARILLVPSTVCLYLISVFSKSL